jgi:hypothetical protein
MMRTIPKRTVIFAISIFPIDLVRKDGVYAAFYQEKLHIAASNKHKAIGKMFLRAVISAKLKSHSSAKARPGRG